MAAFVDYIVWKYPFLNWYLGVHLEGNETFKKPYSNNKHIVSFKGILKMYEVSQVK